MGNQNVTRALELNYPDVDPARPLPLTVLERAAIALSGGIMAFGGARGDLIVLGAGCGLLLICLAYCLSTTKRRIRDEARIRFPELGWAEDTARTRPVLPVFAGLFVLVCLCFFLAPASFALTFATATGLLSAVAIWWCLSA
ncbi:MAG: hypothetical protein MR654_04210 [Corynebacterium glucuronolyticum]|nr:hypothetical protein [Corynebacterium glucuronolyticum]